MLSLPEQAGVKFLAYLRWGDSFKMERQDQTNLNHSMDTLAVHVAHNCDTKRITKPANDHNSWTKSMNKLKLFLIQEKN